MTTGPTKAELLEQNGALKARVQELEDRPVPAPSVRQVGEASALAACVRAIDDLRESARNRSGNDFGALQFGGYRYTGEPGYVTSDVGRILRHLAEKYGVALFELRTEPCQRAHVDAISDESLRLAIFATAQQR